LVADEGIEPSYARSKRAVMPLNEPAQNGAPCENRTRPFCVKADILAGKRRQHAMVRAAWMTRPVLPRLMTVLQTAAFLFRHGSILGASRGFEPWTCEWPSRPARRHTAGNRNVGQRGVI
jgi:hypothetical protein